MADDEQERTEKIQRKEATVRIVRVHVENVDSALCSRIGVL